MIPRAIKRLFHQASIGDQSYRFMFERERTDEVVAIDCETTGLNVRTDDIITIAAIKIRGNRIMTSERFEAAVRPDASMQAEAIKVHRLRQVDVAQGPLIWKALPKLPAFRRRATACRVLRRFRYRHAGQVHPSLYRDRTAQIRASRSPSSTTSASTAMLRPTHRSISRSRQFSGISTFPLSLNTTPSTTR